jgi:hypothetical protein
VPMKESTARRRGCEEDREGAPRAPPGAAEELRRRRAPPRARGARRRRRSRLAGRGHEQGKGRRDCALRHAALLGRHCYSGPSRSFSSASHGRALLHFRCPPCSSPLLRRIWAVGWRRLRGVGGKGGC